MPFFKFWLTAVAGVFIVSSLGWMLVALEWHTPLASAVSRAWLLIIAAFVYTEMRKDEKNGVDVPWKHPGGQVPR